jgi:glycosyltransferase involved in cell wall biosynthesis/GT2 family glycosyltransferase
MSPPKVSLIISTLNRAAHLDRALSALSQLRDPGLEVIVVNGPSRDETAAILAGHGGRLKRADCAQANLAMSRNIGLGLASAEFVGFLDDDAVPHPGWLRRLVFRLAATDLVAVGGYTIGAGGAVFQARKMFCDRHGDSHPVSDFADELQFSRPGSWLYPSPMGTNVMFRRDALERIGGFDETFAYFLDETDVCLRLTDAGGRIGFEPMAFVFHQFASSHLRNGLTAPAELRLMSRSKAYFIARHAEPDQPSAAAAALQEYEDDKRALVTRLCASGAIDAAHAARLRRDITEGLADGRCEAVAARTRPGGHWSPPSATRDFLPFVRERDGQLRIAFVCRSYPPRDESGIPRFTALAARALALRGHVVHVIAEARAAAAIRFEEGLWLHEIPPLGDGIDAGMETWRLPAHVAAWAGAVRGHLSVLEGFGVDVMSAPLWDLEGVGCLGHAPWPIVATLHTPFALARQWNAGWDLEPLLRARLTEGVPEGERGLLAGVDLVLANSRAALEDIAALTELDLSAKAAVVPHGVPPGPAPTAVAGPLRVLFVGRIEGRKGHDIALEAVLAALAAGTDLIATFIGHAQFSAVLASAAPGPVASGRLAARAHVSRDELEAAYASHDVLLMPSRYESFGLTAIEAMTHGCCVIASAVGGLGEIVRDGETGFLVHLDADAPRQIASRLAMLALDRDRLLKLRREAHRDALDRFGVDVMASGIEAAFQTVVRGR